MFTRFRSPGDTVAASGSMFSPCVWMAGPLTDLCLFLPFRTDACNGGGTGDIQSPGSDKISSNRVQSVKCYSN